LWEKEERKRTKKKKERKEEKEKEKATAQIGTNVRARIFKKSVCIRKVLRPANSIKVFRGPRANAELVHKFHVALHAWHAVFPRFTLKISPYTSVTLIFDFNFVLDHFVQRGYG
jgi:hypothetical protein